MRSLLGRDIFIRRCRASEYPHVGRMLVAAYAALPGMPQAHEQPDYYRVLADVGKRDSNPAIRVFVAANELDVPVGSVDFIDDMQHYGAGGCACSVVNAAGIRLLAVRADWRGAGIGSALTRYCIEYARTLHKAKVVLHTTRVMQSAWSMYEHLGFERYPALDFVQGSLEVFGFELALMKTP